MKYIYKALMVIITITSSHCFAQERKEIPKITREWHDSTWYKVQRDLWKKEVKKNRKSESAWFNYFKATRYYLMQSNKPLIGENIVNQLLEEMEKAIPGTFIYNLSKAWHMGSWDYSGSMPYLQEAYRLNPKSPYVYNEFIVRYEVFGPIEKRKEFSKKLYESNEISANLINYNYNVLASLEKDAILITCGDNDTYPLWILQDALGFRTDVMVLNIGLAGIDKYRERVIREAGITLSKELIDSLYIGDEQDPERKKIMQKNIVRVLSENSKRPVYIGLTASGTNVMKAVEDKLYVVGLASKYSEERFDNIALVKKNVEQNFLLDYLQIDFSVDESKGMVNWCNQNYVLPFVSLYKHYRMSGEDSKAEKLKTRIEKIAHESYREKEILDLIK
jgi:hypothetical protein